MDLWNRMPTFEDDEDIKEIYSNLYFSKSYIRTTDKSKQIKEILDNKIELPIDDLEEFMELPFKLLETMLTTNIALKNLLSRLTKAEIDLRILGEEGYEIIKGENYYRDINTLLGHSKIIKGNDGKIYIKQSFPYIIEMNETIPYYQEISVDLKRQYIAEVVMRDILDSSIERKKIKYEENSNYLDKEVKENIKKTVSNKLKTNNEITFKDQVLYIEKINSYSSGKGNFDYKVFEYSSEEDIKKYLKQLGEIAFIHLLLGNVDGILGKFNSEKFIIDENKDLRSIYTNISAINAYLMIKNGVFKIEEKNLKKLFIGNLKNEQTKLFKKLEKIIAQSIVDFNKNEEISFVRRFINMKLGFLSIMGGGLKKIGFDEKRITKNISKGFMSGMLSVFNNFDGKTILIDNDTNIKNEEYNFIKGIFMEAKRILKVYRKITDDFIRIEETYDREGKRIVTKYNNSKVFRERTFEKIPRRENSPNVFERRIYGVKIPEKEEIIYINKLTGGLFMRMNYGEIVEIFTKEKKFVRKSLKYSKYKEKIFNTDIGIGNLEQEAIAGQLLHRFLKIAKSPDTSYRVYWDEKKTHTIAEVYLEFVDQSRDNLLTMERISIAQIMQLGEILIIDMLLGNQDRFIKVFNNGKILVDTKGNLNAIDTTFSTICLYMIWVYNSELDKINDTIYLRNNKDNLDITSDNVDKLIKNIRENIEEFITKYKQQESNDTVFNIIRGKLFENFKTRITEEKFTSALYAGIMRGIKNVSDNYKKEKFPVIDDNIQMGLELLVVQSVFKEVYDVYRDNLDTKANRAYQSYYSNGVVKEAYVFVNGEMNGPYQSYYSNGNIQKEGQMEDGKKVGDWIFYDKNGEEIKEDLISKPEDLKKDVDNNYVRVGEKEPYYQNLKPWLGRIEKSGNTIKKSFFIK